MSLIKKRYFASRSGGAFVRAVGNALMALGIILALLGGNDMLNSHPTGIILVALGVGSFIYGLLTVMAAEYLRIVIDIEENTRRTAYASVLALPKDQWSLFDLTLDKDGLINVPLDKTYSKAGIENA